MPDCLFYDAPIGIKLEAKTPGEIAVSIAGELINERAKKERSLAQ